MHAAVRTGLCMSVRESLTFEFNTFILTLKAQVDGESMALFSAYSFSLLFLHICPHEDALKKAIGSNKDTSCFFDEVLHRESK